MNGKKMEIAHRILSRSREASSRACLLLFGLMASAPLLAQASAATSTSKSDPAALAVVTAALTAMGGLANWQRVGAATAEVSISQPGLPSETVQWADDWSLGYVQSRRARSNGSGTSVTITIKDARFHSPVNGTEKQQHRDSDIAILAVEYPGAALAVSLNNSRCSFRTARMSASDLADQEFSSEDQRVNEDCVDPFAPGGVAHLTWTFSSSTSLPLGVRIPLLGMLHNSELFETVQYAQFEQIQSVLLPSHLNIRRPSGSVEQLAVSNVAFAASLPATTFKTSGN